VHCSAPARTAHVSTAGTAAAASLSCLTAVAIGGVMGVAVSHGGSGSSSCPPSAASLRNDDVAAVAAGHAAASARFKESTTSIVREIPPEVLGMLRSVAPPAAVAARLL